MQTKMLTLMLAPLLIAAAFSFTPAVDSLQEDTRGSSADAYASSAASTGRQLHEPSLQADAGVHGDAPNACTDVESERRLIAEGGLMRAMLIEGEDEVDVFEVPIGTEFVGDRLQYTLNKTLGADLYDLDFDIVDSACGASVFDPDAYFYHPERNAPSKPFADSPILQTTDFDLTNHGCSGKEWKFQIKHLRGANPSALYVEWSNGDYTYIDRDGNDPSQVSKFATTYNLEHTITRIAVQMPISWEGELTVLTGVCDAEEYEVEGPTKSPDGGAFTVTQADEYILIVTMERGPIEKATGAQTRCDEVGCPHMALMSYDSELELYEAPTAA